jgi:hypothetical protein
MSRRQGSRVDDLDACDLSPAQACIAAMLRHAVTDARSTSQGRYDRVRRTKAQQWLRDRPRVMWWLDLAGLPDTTYTALLRAAGLGE